MKNAWMRSPKSRARPLLTEPAGTISHVYFKGSGPVDTLGLAWEQVGTVPQVSASAPLPAGAGPFSDSNYYRVPAASVLNFSGDFYIIYVFKPTDGTGGVSIGHNGTYNVSGFIVAADTTAYLSGAGAVSSSGAGGVSVKNQVNVICAGADAGKASLKVNLAAYRQGTAVTQVANSTTPSAIGKRVDAGGSYLNGTLFEVLFVAGTPSDAIFTAAANEIKSKLGISAW